MITHTIEQQRFWFRIIPQRIAYYPRGVIYPRLRTTGIIGSQLQRGRRYENASCFVTVRESQNSCQQDDRDYRQKVHVFHETNPEKILIIYSYTLYTITGTIKPGLQGFMRTYVQMQFSANYAI